MWKKVTVLDRQLAKKSSQASLHIHVDGKVYARSQPAFTEPSVPTPKALPQEPAALLQLQHLRRKVEALRQQLQHLLEQYVQDVSKLQLQLNLGLQQMVLLKCQEVSRKVDVQYPRLSSARELRLQFNVVSLNLRAAAESRPRKLTTESLPQLEDREPGRPYSLLTEISELKSQLEVSVYRRSLPVGRLRQTDY